MFNTFKLTTLKEWASDENLTIIGDRRKKQSYIVALEQHYITDESFRHDIELGLEMQASESPEEYWESYKALCDRANAYDLKKYQEEEARKLAELEAAAATGKVDGLTYREYQKRNSDRFAQLDKEDQEKVRRYYGYRNIGWVNIQQSWEKLHLFRTKEEKAAMKQFRARAAELTANAIAW